MDKVTYRPKNLPEREVRKSPSVSIFNNIFVKIGLLGIAVFLFYNVAHSIQITYQKVEILRNARNEVEQLRVTNLELETQLDDMQSSEYIEIAARDKLNFSGENETTFVIPDALMATAKESLSEILYGDKKDTNKTIIEQWEDFLVHGV
jgi:cell division protein FtsB